MKTTLAAIIAVSMLAACGGGGSGQNAQTQTGGNSSSQMQSSGNKSPKIAFAHEQDGHYNIDGLSFDRDKAQHMPIYHDDSRILAGIEQSASHLKNLPKLGNLNGTDIYYGKLNDGNGRDAVVEYLEHFQLRRYDGKPKVRIIGPVSDENTERVNAAVQLVNASIPADRKMTIETPVPDETGTDDFVNGRLVVSNDAEPRGLYIEFLPCKRFHHGCDTRYGGVAWNTRHPNGNNNVSYIQMNTDSPALDRDRNSIILLAHEMLHALGFVGGATKEGHIPDGSDIASIMEPAYP